ncbi:MAG: single-stranded-DNA-specific exonuclease RecJ [Pseudomarimonas sp.]
MALRLPLAMVAAASSHAGVTPRLRRRPVPAHGPWKDDVHPILQRVYAARGVIDCEQAALRLQGLCAPDGMSGIGSGVELLLRALRADWRILIVGDFDCDGATASAVAVRGLRMLGARNVNFRVPHRLRHGYGLSATLIADLEHPLPQLIVTVDNGIASHAGVLAASELGIKVLITDHHLPGPSLPLADAIVDPHLPDDQFQSRHLAGVGVMFYLLLALRARMRSEGQFGAGPGPDLAELLDLVALGTVADLVPLDRNNRILVEAGLRRLRSGRGNVGLCALAEVAGRPLASLLAQDFGFALGPRLNAAGRLEDMRLGIECLLTDDPTTARRISRELDGINRERRALQTQMVDEAEIQLADAADHAATAHAAGIVVFDPGWHAGVVGLVASRLKDAMHRPVIAMAPAGEGEGGQPELRGSARSIPGFHVRDALAAIDAAQPGLITRFGGHAMAAGMSLPVSHLDAFRIAFEAIAAQTIEPAMLQAEVWSDGEISDHERTRALAQALRDGGPWGQGFPEPCFDGEFRVNSWRVVGERHLKMRLLSTTGGEVEAIHFGGWTGVAPAQQLRAVYHLELDDFRDRQGIQLRISHVFPV